MTTPERTLDTMSEAIAMSSPSGRMSNRQKGEIVKRLSLMLWGPGGMPRPGLPPQPTEKESLLRQTKELRELANRGMSPRRFRKEADKLEKRAESTQKKGGDETRHTYQNE